MRPRPKLVAVFLAGMFFLPAGILSAQDVAVTKTASPLTLLVGQQVTFTVNVTATGTNKVDKLQVTDLLPAGLSFVSATVTKGSYTSGTGNWNVGTLPKNVVATLTLVAKATAVGTITNTAAYLSSVPTDVNSTNNSSSVSISVSPPNFSTSTKSFVDGNGGSVLPRDTLAYAIKVRNTGGVTATSTSVTDTLPSHVTVVPGSITGGGTYANRKITFPLFNLAANDSVTFQYRVTVDTTITDQFVATNKVTISSSGVVQLLYASFTAANRPQMTMTKSASKSTVIPGDTVTYTVTYSNTGTVAATFVSVSDASPKNTVYVPGSIIVNGNSKTDDAADADGASAISGLISISVGTIQPGESGAFSFKVRVR